jgi:hypothetical protein
LYKLKLNTDKGFSFFVFGIVVFYSCPFSSNSSKQKQNEIGRFRIEIAAKEGEWLMNYFPHGAKPGYGFSKHKVPIGNLMPVTKKQSIISRTIIKVVRLPMGTLPKLSCRMENLKSRLPMGTLIKCHLQRSNL